MDRCKELGLAMYGISNMLDVLRTAKVVTDEEYDSIHSAIWGVVVEAKARHNDMVKALEKADLI